MESEFILAMTFIKSICLISYLLAAKQASLRVVAFSPAAFPRSIPLSTRGTATRYNSPDTDGKAFPSTLQQLTSLSSTLTKEADIISANAGDDDEEEGVLLPSEPKDDRINVVLVTGFESFNRELYYEAGRLLPPECKINLKGMRFVLQYVLCVCRCFAHR